MLPMYGGEIIKGQHFIFTNPEKKSVRVSNRRRDSGTQMGGYKLSEQILVLWKSLLPCIYNEYTRCCVFTFRNGTVILKDRPSWLIETSKW
jgi:hypothetical protein